MLVAGRFSMMVLLLAGNAIAVAIELTAVAGVAPTDTELYAYALARSSRPLALREVSPQGGARNGCATSIRYVRTMSVLDPMPFLVLSIALYLLGIIIGCLVLFLVIRTAVLGAMKAHTRWADEGKR